MRVRRRRPARCHCSACSSIRRCGRRGGFQGIVAGRQLPDGWPEHRSAISGEDFLVDDGETVEHWVTRYEQAAEASRQLVAGMELDDLCARTDIIDGNVRCVLVHTIEETARHAGHADIIRETLDGSRGI